MKIVIPILVLFVTAAFVLIGLWSGGASGWSVGEGTGPTFTSSSASSSGGDASQRAVSALLENVQRRNWDAAYAQLANSTQVDKPSFVRDLAGASGGTQDTLRNLKVVNDQNAWKVIWPSPRFADILAQVIPVNYLRWDVVAPQGGEEWGNRSVDGPHVRIVSMNAVSYQGGSVIMGEAINEDTVPAFVNVNAILTGQDGRSIGDESSFDKILHVLLPKQVTPYRIDFPDVALERIKNVRMDIKTTLVPASADPVIGVMDQAIDTDASGSKVLQGRLLNQSGQIVNIPHVIATFYDHQGKVIWVSDGYVDRALYPETPEPFSVQIPSAVAANIANYHVVVNQYSLEKS